MNELIHRLQAFCARRPASVLLHASDGLLMDIPSGKVLPLRAAELTGAEETPGEGDIPREVRLFYPAERALALTEDGLAFAPDRRNTGALPALGQRVTFRGYAQLLARLKEELYVDESPTRDTVRLLMAC